MENLGELREWESVVADNVSKVEASSKDLYEKSKENEKLLQDLHTINQQGRAVADKAAGSNQYSIDNCCENNKMVK